MAKIVKVVAGVLTNGSQVLITSRPSGKAHAGAWEFPGGKLEGDESAIDALIRELAEEIGVIVNACDCEPFTFIMQSYSHADIELNVMLVKSWQGSPTALEQQKLHWQNLGQLCEQEPLLTTTQKILDLLQTAWSCNKA